MKKFYGIVTILSLLLLANTSLHSQSKREKLVLSDSMWNTITQSAGFKKPFGYTDDEMKGYGPDEFVMRNVWSLFRNAKTIPRYSGTVTKNLLDNHKDVPALIRNSFGLTDIAAGRFLTAPPATSWGVDWLKDSTDMIKTWNTILSKMKAKTVQQSTFTSYPYHVQKLILRCLIGILESQEWVEKSFPQKDFYSYSGFTEKQTIDDWYSFAAAPWTDDKQGQLVTLYSGTFSALKGIDRKYLAFGSVLLATHIQYAINEYRTADSLKKLSAVKGMFLQTPLGDIRILGTATDTVKNSALLTIDLGGNDVYKGRQAVSNPFKEPVSVLIDMNGNDVYDCDTSLSLGCGIFGVGYLFDAQGDDKYRVKESGIGCAWYGTGAVIDMSGNDTYVTDKMWGQGAAHIGIGLVADWNGNDSYTCAEQSQGLGSTLGAGVLLDVSGNDRYIARDDGNPTPIYLNQSVSMSQGCGFGRRADIGDGHSLAGGVGVLADGAGDDYYSAPVWSQGCGYWWAVGICEDRSGNDTWRSGKYSLGSAAHFAIGCKVDVEGNDTYAVGYKEAVNQYLGHARDGSIGISIDGEGDDTYYLKNNCAGSSDLGSLALLWDAAGNDTYTGEYTAANKTDGWSDTPPLGSASGYTPFYTFRDDIQSYGLFIDTGGNDTYTIKGTENSIPWSVKAENNTQWLFIRSPRERGFGIDTEVKTTEKKKTDNDIK